MLKPRGTKLLKLKFDELLSGVAFKFNLRRYNMGATFVDSIIRAGVPFQLSRLLTPMLRAAARAGGSTSGYDAIVLGTSVGRLLECDRHGLTSVLPLAVTSQSLGFMVWGLGFRG
jgi:hypothetical protein